MEKRIYGSIALTILLIFFVSSFNLFSTAQEVKDPNIIHITIPTEKDESLISLLDGVLDSKPEYNKFNDIDQIIIDRKTNTFFIFAITEDTADAFERESNMMASNGVKEITINLHSPGGKLFSAYVIVQQMKILNEKGIKIKTIVGSKNACMSACPLIFLAGDEKVSFSNSVFMFHSPYITMPYNLSENIIIELERELRTDRELYANALAKACPTDKTIKMDIMDHNNHYYRADDVEKRCPKTFFDELIVTIETKTILENHSL